MLFCQAKLNRFAAGMLTGLIFASSCPAGRVELSGGGQLTGEVRKSEKADGSTAHVVVRIDEDLAIAVEGVYVRRVIEDSDLKEYRDRAATVGEDAEAHFQLSRWCKSKTLLAQHHFHLTQTIEIDPDHSLARAALGYVQNPEGRGWVSYELLRRSQGLIRDRKSGWVLPEVLASRQYADETNKQAKLWIREFSRLHSRATRGDAEAIAEIEAITDPLATGAIARELQRTRKSTNLRTLRRLYVRLLGRLRNLTAVAALVKVALYEPDQLIREDAVRELKEFGGGSAVATCLPMLKSNSPAQVQAAVRVLADFPEPELAFVYVDALITGQKIRTQIGSGGTDAGFGNNGVSGLSQGAQIVERTESTRNPEILRILKTIAPDADYGFNESAWRNYFASLRNPPRSDLRRDP